MSRPDIKKKAVRGLVERRERTEITLTHNRLCSDLTRQLRHWLRRRKGDDRTVEHVLPATTVRHLIKKFGQDKVHEAVRTGCPPGWHIQPIDPKYRDEIEKWVFIRT